MPRYLPYREAWGGFRFGHYAYEPNIYIYIITTVTLLGFFFVFFFSEDVAFRVYRV